jgi:hypothetical protein
VPSLTGDILEKIEAYRILKVCWIEVHHIVGTPRRNMVEHVTGEIPMGINDTDSATCPNVLKNEIPEERGLSGARLPNAVKVLPTICTAKTKRF